MIEIEQSSELFNTGTAAPPVGGYAYKEQGNVIIMYIGSSNVVGPVCSGWLYSVHSRASVEAVC